jgi:uncharacterized Zn finger protein (UPF0148 family)
MTGKHCGECGDPIFRYDGQEFCPTCQREVEGGAAQQSGGEGQESGDTDQQGAAQRQAAAESDEQSAEPSTTAGSDADESNRDGAEETTGTGDEGADDEPRVEINDVRVADQHADRSNPRQPPSQQGERDPTTRRESPRARAHDHAHERAHSGERTHSGGRAHAPASDAGDLATARESLVRTLTDLARRAEETDDVARSRDLLAATREAAEALAALDRANR